MTSHAPAGAAQYDAAARLLAERPYLVELATHLDRALQEFESRRTAAGTGASEAVSEEGAPTLFRLARAHAHSDSDELDEAIDSKMDLAKAGTLRRAAKAVEAALPDIILDATIDGYGAADIARRLGHANESYVYRILRKHPWTAEYRIDTPDEGEGAETETGTREVFKDDAEQVALTVFGNAKRVTRGARVRIWRAGNDENVPRVDTWFE
ncbi:hypothetical protein ACH4SK_13875 [Streptomyces inhibens]|uniref:hypothetical protein n=1 Tax=Streptomyces inhibens TaxID=2293571 RepID=UPI0037ABAD84